MAQNHPIFQKSLFPLEKEDFNAEAFQNDCLTTTLCKCIYRAAHKSVEQANLYPTVSEITKLGIIHDLFYRNIENEFQANYSENPPFSYYSSTGNVRSYIVYDKYAFVFNKQGASKNRTSVLDVIKQQQADCHILSLEYVLDATNTMLQSVVVTYTKGNSCNFYYSIQDVEQAETNATFQPQSNTPEVQPILPKLKNNKSEKMSS